MAAPAYRASITGGGTTGTGDRTIVFTPQVGDLAVVFYCVSDCSDAAPTCSDTQGTTYTLVATAIWGATSQNRLYCFVADRLQPAAVNTTLTVDTTSNTAGEYALLAMSNFTKVGANAVRSIGTLDNGVAASTPAVTLNQNALTRNPTAVAIGSADSSTTPPTNWTERQENSQATPTTVIEVSTRDSGFTGNTITFPATCDTTHAVIAVELDGDAPITGSCAAAITFAGTLVATGALAGTCATTYAFAGTLIADAAITGTCTAAFAFAGALIGTGALTGTCATSFAFAGELENAANESPIDGEIAIATTWAGTLTGTGALTGSLAAAIAMSGTLTGAGSLTGSIASAFAFNGQMVGTLALDGTFAIALAFDGSLGGLAATSGTWAMQFTLSAELVDVGNPAPVIEGPVASRRTTAAASTRRTIAPSDTERTTEPSDSRRTTAPASTRTEEHVMGKAWFINADDEAGALVEQIVRPAFTDKDGTEVPLEAIDIEDAEASLQYWDGDSWVTVAGTAIISDSGEVDSQARTIWQVSFVRDEDATIGLSAGEHPRRWLFAWLGGVQQLRVPEKGHDRIVVNANPS